MSYVETKLARIPAILQSPSRFVDNLPRVPRADLPDSEYDRRCAICHEDFKTVDQDVNGEQAVRLSCGHVFGKDCLLALLFNHWDTTPDTTPPCPMCRTSLPQLITPANEEKTKCSHFLLWVVRNYRHRGAALDRLYQLNGAVSQAIKLLIGFENWCDHENGGLSTLDYRYMHVLEQLACIDTDGFHCPSDVVEELHDCLDQIMVEYKEHPYRRAPRPPMIGRRPRLMNILATHPSAKPADVGLEEGEVFEGLDCELGDRTNLSSTLPLWVCNLFEQDFADIPRDELFEELRSRRFAYAVGHDRLPLHMLTQLAASEVNDEMIEEYTRAHAAVGDQGRQREYHFVLNCASDTLEYMAVDY